MNELVITNSLNMEEYETLLFEKEDLLKECENLTIEYLRIFGEKMKESFLLKIECISKKKKIAYCQSCINRGLEIDESLLNEYIDKQMRSYEKRLKNLCEDIRISNDSRTVSSHTLMKIKKVYRRIVKMIHPDINPSLKDDLKVTEYFNRVTLAYRHSNLEELLKLEDLIIVYLKTKGLSLTTDIEDIDKKIEKLQTEIEEIKSTDPYQYKYLFEDDEEVEQKLMDYDDEIEEYTKYSKDLDEILSGFHIERKYS